MRGLVTAVSPIDAMPPSASETFAVQRRRASRRDEWREQIKLCVMLDKYLPEGAFWTSLENKPTLVSVASFKRNGVSGPASQICFDLWAKTDLR